MGFIGAGASMVMIKHPYIIVLIFSCFINTATLASDNHIELLKRMQLYLDKNQPEKTEELYDDKEDILSEQWMALERLALSFERRKKYKEAIEVYRKIINKFNKQAHDKIISTSERLITAEIYETNKLPFYYYKLAFLSTQLFSNSHAFIDESVRNKYKKNAEGFIGLSRKVKTDESDLKYLEDELKEKLVIEEGLQYKSKWYVMFDAVSWQDRIRLINTVTSQKYNLLNTNLGTCIGAGKKWQNSTYEFDFEGCLLVATSTISSESTEISYQQSKVPVLGAILGPGMYFRAFSENLLLGFQLPIMYRKGDWTLPANLQYRFEKAQSLEVGSFVQSKFKVKKIYIRTRMGIIFSNPGSYWSLGAVYDF